MTCVLMALQGTTSVHKLSPMGQCVCTHVYYARSGALSLLLLLLWC
jgi:hypothetical protein